MFPRRSAVLRYVFFGGLLFVVLFLWMTGPDSGAEFSPWRRYLLGLEPLNETKLLMEFDMLRHELNETSYTAENKSLEEIYRYIQAMRTKLPANPHKFKYIINPMSICTKKDIFLLAYIHSSPEHYKRRTAIRQTWGNSKNFPGLRFRLVFLMGKPKDTALQEALHMESDIYNDIVQEDFIDTYRNLTYKAIMGLKWISSYCPHAKFILKTDDDIFVNIFNLVSHLQSLSQHGMEVRKLLLCLVWYRMKVMRDTKSKWYLSPSEFKDDYFPTYCSGSAYIMSSDVVRGMYNASLQTPFFWVDDFYITGLLAQKLQIVHKKFNSVYTLGPSTFLEKFTQGPGWRTLVFGHVHNLNHMVLVWNNIMADRAKTGGKT